MAGTNPAFDANRSWEWLAGLYEGEGWVTTSKVGRDARSLRIGIKMTDRDVLESARVVAGGRGVMYGPYQRGPAHYKPWHEWIIASGPEARKFALEIRPFLHSRRQHQIDEAIQLWDEAQTAVATAATWDLDTALAQNTITKEDHVLWLGAKTDSGYGQFWHADEKRFIAAHHVTIGLTGVEVGKYENFFNQCGNRLCLTPSHWKRSSESCKKGHSRPEFGFRSNGRWRCRLCNRLAQRRHHQKVHVDGW